MASCEVAAFSMTTEMWLGLPLTMLRCFFQRYWGVQMSLNLGCCAPNPVTAWSKFIFLINWDYYN